MKTQKNAIPLEFIKQLPSSCHLVLLQQQLSVSTRYVVVVAAFSVGVLVVGFLCCPLDIIMSHMFVFNVLQFLVAASFCVLFCLLSFLGL